MQAGLPCIFISTEPLNNHCVRLCNNANICDENYNGWGEEDDDFGNRLYVAGVKGKELKTPNMQIHLWHYSDPTKKHSMNEEYYYKRKKEIFSNKNYFCKNGCSETRDDIKITILK